MVKRQMRNVLQMSQTSAKPNIFLAWLVDGGRSQQVDILTSQNLRKLFALVFQFSCLSDTEEKQLPIFLRKKEEEDKIEGQAL